MASVILVVGFMGMIQAVTIGSEMLATARRQTIAAQIINHEMDYLRLTSWTNLQTIATTTTWSAGTAYAVDAVVQYQGGRYICIVANTGQNPGQTTYWAAAPSTWSGSNTYSFSNIVYYSTDGNWYRYINATPSSGNLPSDTTYWKAYTGPLTTSTAAGGATFSITRSVVDVTTDLREITISVSWTKGGTTTAASTPTGSWLQKLAFYRESPIARTYTRSSTTWLTKYGLNHAAQRS